MTIETAHFKRHNSTNGQANFRYWHTLTTQTTAPDAPPLRCLIIRPDGIGDYVLFLPALARIRQLYPQHHITFMGMCEVCDLAYASGCVDDLLIWDRAAYEQRGEYWQKWLESLHTPAFDTVLYPCLSREANIDEMIAVIRARHRIGIRGNDCNCAAATLNHNEQFYTRLVDMPLTAVHTLEHNAAFADALGTPATHDRCPLWTSFDRERVRALDLPRQFCVVAPGSRIACKQWPIKNFIRLIDAITDAYAIDIILLGAPGEKSQAAQIQAAVRHPQRIRSLVGTLPVRQSAAVIGHSCYFIGNDSGLAHIAQRLGIAGQIVVGGAHFGRFFPYPEPGSLTVTTHMLNCFNCDWRCCHDHARCIHESVIDSRDVVRDIARHITLTKENKAHGMVSIKKMEPLQQL